MTIRSLDMQVLVQKVGDVAKIQQSEQVGANKKQQEFQEAINLQTCKNSTTARKIDQKKTKLSTNKDKEKENKKNLIKKRYLNDDDTEDKIIIDPERGNNIDIKI